MTGTVYGKRLRYAIEVLAGCFAPPLRGVIYPAVERVQEVLGALQDATVAAELIGRVGGELRMARPATAERIGPGLAALADEVRRRSALQERTFHDWVGDWSRLTAEHPAAELVAAAVG